MYIEVSTCCFHLVCDGLKTLRFLRSPLHLLLSSGEELTMPTVRAAECLKTPNPWIEAHHVALG